MEEDQEVGVLIGSISITTTLKSDGTEWTHYELSDGMSESVALGLLTRTAHEIMHDCRERGDDD